MTWPPPTAYEYAADLATTTERVLREWREANMDPTKTPTADIFTPVNTDDRTVYKTGEDAVLHAKRVRMPRASTTSNRPRKMSKLTRRMLRNRARSL